MSLINNHFYNELFDRLKGKKAQILCVSKNRSLEAIKAFIEIGQKDFGENRVLELEQKANAFKEQNICWHFIGHLQTNKVKKLFSIENLKAVHSVSSLSLIKEMIKRAEELPRDKGPLELYLQVNTSNEDEKSGFFTLEELSEAMDLLKEKNSSLKVVGLMTMATWRTENKNEQAHHCFSTLLQMKKDLEEIQSLKSPLKLSMGMSGDFEVALQYETNWIRIGTALFES